MTIEAEEQQKAIKRLIDHLLALASLYKHCPEDMNVKAEACAKEAYNLDRENPHS